MGIKSGSERDCFLWPRLYRVVDCHGTDEEL